jgi:Asp-tRNA(Asn)/Glu-tRNA(Gln) amidotransferase A subunit family amidase
MEQALAERELLAVVHGTDSQAMVGLTNLTGHPAVVAPGPSRADGTPTSVTFTGPLAFEEPLFALASAWQRASTHHRRHPVL